MKTKTTTTVEMDLDQLKQMIAQTFKGCENLKINFIIREVDNDPMDRYPGRNEVVGVQVSYDGFPKAVEYPKTNTTYPDSFQELNR